jgi:Archaeal enzymes of ATP-grasp superfamily
LIKFLLKGISADALKGSTLITGFRTIGEVGYLAVRHLILSGGFRRVGFIETKRMRDVAFVEEYGLAAPFEIFLNEDLRIVAILNHLLPHQAEWAEFSKGIVEWALKHEISEGIFIGGLDKRYAEGNEKLRWLKTSSSTRNLNYPYMEKQLFIVGPLALLTIYSEFEAFPSVVILPYADRDRPDPAAAAIAIETINEMLNVKFETASLYEEAKKIEEEIQKQFEIIQKELMQPGSGSGRIYM